MLFFNQLSVCAVSLVGDTQAFCQIITPVLLFVPCAYIYLH